MPDRLSRSNGWSDFLQSDYGTGYCHCMFMAFLVQAGVGKVDAVHVEGSHQLLAIMLV